MAKSGRNKNRAKVLEVHAKGAKEQRKEREENLSDLCEHLCVLCVNPKALLLDCCLNAGTSKSACSTT
jgi:hypothetical protein